MASVSISGDVSGAISIAAPSAAGSGVLTLPTGTDTLIGKATTDTLTNKSIAATQLTGTIAAAALPAGSVLQVVNATYATLTSKGGTSFADTGLTATITPKFSTSKILVSINHAVNYKDNANATNSIGFNLCRNGSQIVVLGQSIGFTNTALILYFNFNAQYVDSPSTTSATIYKTQFQNTDSAGGTVYVQASGIPSTITLMEIAG